MQPIIILCLFLTGATVGRTAGAEEGGRPVSLEDLQHRAPSDQYIDPASFFRLHGYITLSYTQAGEQLGLGPGSRSQILVPGLSLRTGENEGGFTNDAALFIGGEPLDGVGGVLELHFVGDATAPVLTEAKLVWNLTGDEPRAFSFRLVGGRYWWPFGIHNEEWFSAINPFSLISPAAMEGVPAHYNEVGLMGEGEFRIANHAGLNYALSVGNGVPGFALEDNVRKTRFDANGNRTLTGRVGLVLESGPEFELGFSAAGGMLRANEDLDIPRGDPARYKADFTALGPDLRLRWKSLGLRSYVYRSTEELGSAPVDELVRTGLTVEPTYVHRRATERFGEFSLIGRYSQADEETIEGRKHGWTQIGIGLSTRIARGFQARLSFVHQGERKDLPELDDDAINLSLTTEF